MKHLLFFILITAAKVHQQPIRDAHISKHDMEHIALPDVRKNAAEFRKEMARWRPAKKKRFSK